jgi:hypothetical protein
MDHMKAWTASAILNYYLDPEIVFVEAGHRCRPGHRHLTQAGYYVAPHGGPDCCQALGGISRFDFGPFLTPDGARTWLVKNMAMIN